MTTFAPTYITIALAELALTQAGFRRDANAAMWVLGNVRAKVERHFNYFVITQK